MINHSTSSSTQTAIGLIWTPSKYEQKVRDYPEHPGVKKFQRCNKVMTAFRAVHFKLSVGGMGGLVSLATSGPKGTKTLNEEMERINF